MFENILNKAPKTVDSVIIGLTTMLEDLETVCEEQDTIAEDQRLIVIEANRIKAAAVNESSRAMSISGKIKALIS